MNRPARRRPHPTGETPVPLALSQNMRWRTARGSGRGWFEVRDRIQNLWLPLSAVPVQNLNRIEFDNRIRNGQRSNNLADNAAMRYQQRGARRRHGTTFP